MGGVMMDFKKMAAAFAAGGAILAAGAAYSLNHKKQCEYPSEGLNYNSDINNVRMWIILFLY